MILTAQQAKLLASTADTETPEEKWKPLFLQIEAAARGGWSSIDCLTLIISPDLRTDEMKALVMALGYKWESRPDGYFEISWF